MRNKKNSTNRTGSRVMAIRSAPKIKDMTHYYYALSSPLILTLFYNGLVEVILMKDYYKTF